MKPMSTQFSGAKEFVRFDITVDSSNHDLMFMEVACAA
jgi:hypothetical protein